MQMLGDRIGQEASIRAQLGQHWAQRHLYDAETQKRLEEYKSKVGSVASAFTLDPDDDH
jgi:hypothetical protein